MSSRRSHVFGPVPSRRLGRSLGVDPVPFKTCNWNCVYCQLGRSSPLISERGIYVPTAEVIDDLRAALSAHEGALDWVTFVGSGEPTLHSELGVMIREAKRLTDVPVAVVTNGALLFREDVRADLLPADAVLPTVMAGSRRLHLQIHRPARELGFERFVEGLLAFREGFAGKLWPEVLLIAGLNDTEEALADLASLLTRLRPDAVHIILPTRPPNESWVEAPPHEGLARARRVLGAVAEVVAPDLGLDSKERDGTPGSSAERSPATGEGHPLEEAVLGVIVRHPMTAAELARALTRSEDEIDAALAALVRRLEARRVKRHGRVFYSAADARFVEGRRSPAPRARPG